MVGTRSGRRTSRNTTTMEDGQAVSVRPDKPDENDTSSVVAVYDLPSDSSNDTNSRNPMGFHKKCASSDLAEGTSLIQIPSGSRRRKSRSFSVSSESSPKKLDRLQPSRNDDEMNTTPSHVDDSTTVLPNTAPAKTGGEVASPNSALKRKEKTKKCSIEVIFAQSQNEARFRAVSVIDSFCK
ncbi:hypothetical protein OSTOST_10446 [Ostertagia ostertagi]